MLRSIKPLLLLIVLFYFNLHAQQKAVNAFYHASEIVVDSRGNLFVSGKNNKIIKITPDGAAYHFAGHPKGYTNSKDGKGAEAMFNGIKGLAIDKDDNIYVSDYNVIRKVTPDAVVSTIYGRPGKNGIKDGHSNEALFYRVGAIAVDQNGTLYVTDETFDSLQKRRFHIIRKVSPAGNVQTIRNNDGSNFRAHTMEGLACDKDGNLYVARVAWSACISKITPDGKITTIAGVYDENVKNRSHFKEGDVKTARIVKPRGLAINQQGELIFSDPWISRILKYSNNRIVIIAGGGGKSADGANFMGGGGGGGHADGKGKAALFESPNGIAFDKTGNLFIVDASSNSCIRKLSPDGMVTTFCKHEYNPLTKQYESGPQLQNANVSVDQRTIKKVANAPQTAFDKQLDSMLNDPNLKKLMDYAQTLNVDSIKRAAEEMARTASAPLKEEDTTNYALPGKNIKALAKIPKQVLSSAELKSYAATLYKQLAPAFRSAYGTPLVNTSGYDANTVGNAAVFATEAARLDQAVLLALKAIERSPEDPVLLNNAGAIFKKGGLEIAAVTVLEAADKKDPGNSTIQNNLGQVYLALGEREKAGQYLQRAIMKSPYHPLANTSLAVIELTKGNKPSALKYTEHSLRGGFTDKAWHLLYKLKRDASLMNYFRHRYKQPEYFNEDKYHLPMQCEKVIDIPAKKAEYEAYTEMLRKVKEKFDETAKEEMKAASTSMMQKAKNGQLSQSPFMQLANAMMLDRKLQMEKESEKISESQKNYKASILRLQVEYKEKYNKTKGCGSQIALANEYMEKMSVVTREYQKTYLRIYKDFYHDMTYWSFFSSSDPHLRKGSFCSQASGLLGVLLQLAETHYLEVTIDCASNEKLKKEAEEIKIEGSCPVGDDGYEIPFGIGKFNINCEKWEFQFGEALVFNVGHKFNTGETTWALGPGISFIGSGHGALKKVPEIKAGPITGGLDAGIKAQVFLTFRNGNLTDWGGLFDAELDLLGVAKEFKTGYTIGMNSGLQMVDGPLKNVIDRALGPDGEAPQINKNIKIYKPE
jgi:DNA-binding beta-propeller fold protein YncE/Flp pilus assembly protein TadD